MGNHANCNRRINGTVAMADAIVEECGASGQVFDRDELQNLIDTLWTGNTRTGRIENVLTVLEVRGQLHIARAPEKRNHSAAFLADDIYLIAENTDDLDLDRDEEPDLDVIGNDDEPSDWAALLANEELIAGIIENASDEELGFPFTTIEGGPTNTPIVININFNVGS